MNGLSTLYRFIWVSAWYAFAAVVVLVATTFAAARLLLPYAEQYNTEIGERLSSYLGQPVSVRALDAEWHGWGPSLVFKDTVLLDANGEKPVLRLAKIRLGLDLLASLNRWQPVFSHITLVGADLELKRARDGQLSAAGFSAQTQDSNAAKTTEDVAPFMAWLFSQGRIGLEQSNITWRDEMGTGRVMRFSAVNVSLHNDGDRHQLDAAVTLSRDLGKSLVLRVDMQGNPLQVEGRRTRIFLAGEHVHLTELFDPQSLGDVNVSVKRASFQVWAEWFGGQLQQLKGNLDAAGLALVPMASEQAKTALALERMAGDFMWQKLADGWRFDGNDVELARQSRKWHPSRISINFASPTEGADMLDAYASYLQLEDVAHFLSLFSVGGDVVQQPLFALNPRGEIRDAQLFWRNGPIPDYRAYAMLRNATVQAWRSVPAAEEVDGQLWVDADGGQVSLRHAAVTLDFPKLFRWPLRVDELRGKVSWEQADDAWRVAGRDLEASNEDVTTSATLDVVKSAGDPSPFMSLLVDFHDGDGSQVARYLPTGVMSVAAVNWLDEAIVDARVVSGGALFHGRLADFPFDQGNGRFEVDFRAENASLNYAQFWPPITGIAADVRFVGRSLFVDGQKGKIFSNDIQWAKVAIADMTTSPLVLKIDGDVQGSTQEKLDYLVSSPPLYAAFAQHLEGMTANGNSDLHLDLTIPIGGDAKAKVNGWVTMQENTLSIPPLGQVLSQVDGRLSFFEGGLRAEDINADLFGQPTKINILTDESAVAPKVRIRAKGLFDAPDIAARYLPAIEDLLAGTAEWNVSFDIPVGGAADAHRVAVLQAQTNLRGVEARLPPPFDKQAEDAGSLELRVDFEPRQLPVLRVNYAGFVDAIFALGDVADDGRFRGEVRLNGGAAQMPVDEGLNLTGWLDTVSLDDWRNLGLADTSSATGELRSPWLTGIDVAVRDMEAYGQRLHNTRFKLATLSDRMLAEIDSQEVKGQFTIPADLQQGSIQAELDYCHLVELAEGAGDIDPRTIPSLDIRIGDFRYKDSQFGAVRLETTKVADGLRIEQLLLKPRSTSITVQGGWTVRGNEQNSTVKMHVESRNIGHTLKALGYVGGIDRGEGSADLDVSWPGAFADVDASLVRGTVKMSLKDGHLLDVDPGAGRMFGMLSIQTLPRRLLLDFSDVFKKGFGFDRIRGSFDIEDGDAYTNNLYMDGPAARVDIVGRTGLAQQDYDQLVTVTPHVAETLPVLGVLTATPQVGAIILGIQKLFQPQIDDVTRNQYTITGSWSAPVIKKVKAAKKDNDKAKNESP